VVVHVLDNDINEGIFHELADSFFDDCGEF
jgi:hypothetical protein